MPENKTKPTAISVSAYIDAIPEEAGRADAKALVKLMKRLTGEPARMWGPSIIGFGTHHYIYESGREGDTLIIGFSPRKSATVLYGLRSGEDSASLFAKLGKHTTGKGCLYIKKLTDIDFTVLETLIVTSLAARRTISSS